MVYIDVESHLTPCITLLHESEKPVWNADDTERQYDSRKP